MTRVWNSPRSVVDMRCVRFQALCGSLEEVSEQHHSGCPSIILKRVTDDGRTQLNDFWKGSLKGDALSWVRIQRKDDSWPASGGYKLMAATEDRM